MKQFTIFPTNTNFWNRSEFIDFLVQNQGQAIQVSTKDEGPCLATIGVYKLLEQFKYKTVKILTNNVLEHHDTFQIEQEAPFYYFEILKDDYTAYHTWSNLKVFGCFYNRPLWHRIALAATLQHDYPDISLINVRCSPSDVNNLQLFEVQQLFEMHADSFVKFSKIFKSWPIQLEPVDTYGFCNTTEHTDQLAQFYTDFLIDIVAETWVTGQTFYLTEKTVRPMLLKKPFIVFGSRDCLLYLRQMGFRTFADFWDEDYDAYEGKDRYLKILKLIDHLANKSLKELETMYWDMQYTLDHNYNLLIDKKYTTEITQV
jgi:hypothetical protein